MKFTRYFESVVPLKHPGIELQWIQRVLDNPIKRQIQDDGRISFWGNIAEMEVVRFG